MTLVFTTCYHATVVLIVFEKLFLLPGKGILCVIFSLKLLYLHDFQTFRQIPASLLQFYYNVFMPYDVSDVLQYVQDEGCLKCKTFKTCNIWHMECLGCGMFGM